MTAAPPKESSKVYDADELAALFKVSRKTIDRWTKVGRLPGVLRLSIRRTRYDREKINAWIADGCPGKPDCNGKSGHDGE
ncbi:helix-turn-helix transcriptional regulator [Zavarzinella formosa]|uniref:helix-turn-helix transcriptional regulator n=1 Tax=Zavarzinella formosa TaxID=360055 RepID=UPI0002F769CC|nr:helix-turn-helix domain-containing protein [Zavarzinella formosa]